MENTQAAVESTPDGSLDAVATRIEGLLTRKEKADTQAPEKSQPEPSAKKDESPAKQVPAAPEAKAEAKAPESEQVEDGAEVIPPPKMHKVKAGEEELEVPEEELIKSYLRNADYTRKTQELAKQRKEFEEGELKAARDHRAAQQSALTQLQSAIESIAPKEPDWNALKASLTPDAYADRVLEWRDRKDALEKISAEQQRLKAEETAEADKGFASYVAEQRAHLERELPEFKDPEKGPKLLKDLSAFAKSRGFSEEEIGQVYDHRLMLLLNDAFQHQQAKAKAPEIKTKLDKAIEAAAPSNSQPRAQKSEKDKARERFHKSGKPEDAAKVFEHLI